MSKKLKVIMITLTLVLSLVISFGAGCALGANSQSETDLGLEVIEEVWGIIFRDYVEKDRLDAGALSKAAIKGIVDELDDPYTSYLDTQTYHRNISSLEGKYEGIGAYVGMKDEQIQIISPIPGSPAAQAGIRTGDIVLEIDGRDTVGMSLEEAVLEIRGPRGTTVRLLIRHTGEDEAEEIEVVRAEIELSSVYSEMKGDIAYINLHYFSERTNVELGSALTSLKLEDASGIILDLRSNPGGLLNTVVDVTSRFISEGVVVHVVDNQGERTSLSVRPEDVTTDLPMVVLTDNFSASGSEVLAGALQDHNRAVIAGTITYGKGSVNTLRQLKDGSGLYITTARWLTPDGRLIEGEGIVPDPGFELELEGEALTQWAIDYLKGNEGGSLSP